MASGTVISGGGLTLHGDGSLAVDTQLVSNGAGFDLPDLTFDHTDYDVPFGAPPTSITVDPSTDVLTVLGAGSTSVTLQLAGDYTGEYFVPAQDVTGGTSLVLQIPCFAAGTRITTETGAAAVEALRIGDRLRLADGRLAPVVWLGRHHVECDRHFDPKQVWPVRVTAHGLAPNQPCRDLLLSPDHAVFVDGVLVPVRYLINGTTVAQIPVRAVTYFHIELPSHDILLAEALPVESYLDTGDRHRFEARDPRQPGVVHPAHLREAKSLAPLIVTGPRLDAIRRRLNARANAVIIAEASVSA